MGHVPKEGDRIEIGDGVEVPQALRGKRGVVEEDIGAGYLRVKFEDGTVSFVAPEWIKP